MKAAAGDRYPTWRRSVRLDQSRATLLVLVGPSGVTLLFVVSSHSLCLSLGPCSVRPHLARLTFLLREASPRSSYLLARQASPCSSYLLARPCTSFSVASVGVSFDMSGDSQILLAERAGYKNNWCQSNDEVITCQVHRRSLTHVDAGLYETPYGCITLEFEVRSCPMRLAIMFDSTTLHGRVTFKRAPTP